MKTETPNDRSTSGERNASVNFTKSEHCAWNDPMEIKKTVLTIVTKTFPPEIWKTMKLLAVSKKIRSSYFSEQVQFNLHNTSPTFVS